MTDDERNRVQVLQMRMEVELMTTGTPDSGRVRFRRSPFKSARKEVGLPEASRPEVYRAFCARHGLEVNPEALKAPQAKPATVRPRRR